MGYKYFGKVFKIPFPFTDLSSKKSRPALAVSEPDNLNDIEFLFITTKRTRGFDRIVSIEPGDYTDKGLPYESIVHIGKPYLLNASVVGKYLCEMTKGFMEKILRELIYRETTRFYNYFHAPESKEAFTPSKSKINYAGRVYDEKEMINLVDSALDFWLTAGRYAEVFEKDFAKFLGVKYCSLTNSGSSANLLAFMALTSPKLGDRRIQKGDEVITVAAGFPTTVTPIIQYGAIPVFVDVTLPTYNVDCDLLEAALSPKTKAVMLAHTLGNPFDIDRVLAFCQKHNLWLIEDCCDALGSTYTPSQLSALSFELSAFDQSPSATSQHPTPRKCGTFGHIATFSFYPPHHITMGEGGAVCTNDIELKRLVESFRDWGRDCWCAPGKDNTCGKRFSQQLGELPYGEATPNSDPSWFGFLLTVRENAGFTRDEIVKHLEAHNIQTRMLFSGNIIKHPCFDDIRASGQGCRVVGELTSTDVIMSRTFWLGVYPGMTEEMIN
ncbi:MAG: lipopolysaccharide biosynthesis protein RfbH, partial [Deltaproteobacteria bacterium]